jgi:hypothetical protein
MTLYAKWVSTIIVTGSTLIEKMQWISSNAVSDGNYSVEVNSTEYLIRTTLSYSGRDNITIRLFSTNFGTIIPYGNGSFIVDTGVTLIIGGNIILDGVPVNIISVGTLILNDNAKITNGGVESSGIFIMNSGEITNASRGVLLTGGTFTMNGGEITNNTSISSSLGGGGGGGIGVYIRWGSTFIMNGGKISNNRYGGYHVGDVGGGGGVRVDGNFIMNNGIITGNYVTASSQRVIHGGGVFLSTTGIFEKTGGIITGYQTDMVNGNRLSHGDAGHAVFVYHYQSTFRRVKNTTAGESDNLIYISNGNLPPTISGAWD